MATEAEWKKIAVKAIEDDEFRAAFVADPAKAASSLDITITPEEVAAIEEKKAQAEAAGIREAKMEIFISFIFGPPYG